MTTFVGTQSDFVEILKELIELDYDAVEGYQTAIDTLKNKDYKVKLQSFREDHINHIKNLNEVLIKHNQEKIKKPDMKKWLIKGKIKLGSITGEDINILKVMVQIEDDTNLAYERANNYKEPWEDAIDPLRQGLMDEKIHREWLREILEKKK